MVRGVLLMAKIISSLILSSTAHVIQSNLVHKESANVVVGFWNIQGSMDEEYAIT